MNSRAAIRTLQAAGYTVLRKGKGDHVILQRPDGRRIIIPGGKQELASGLVRAVERATKGKQ
jgi:predicted RNA binding protein YcfA (HicA-like mRNA interferase family)